VVGGATQIWQALFQNVSAGTDRSSLARGCAVLTDDAAFNLAPDTIKLRSSCEHAYLIRPECSSNRVNAALIRPRNRPKDLDLTSLALNFNKCRSDAISLLLIKVIKSSPKSQVFSLTHIDYGQNQEILQQDLRSSTARNLSAGGWCCQPTASCSSQISEILECAN